MCFIVRIPKLDVTLRERLSRPKSLCRLAAGSFALLRMTFGVINPLEGTLNMTTLAPTITIRTFPRAAGWLRDAILIVLGALFVAMLAQIEIPLPFSPVPITGQT